MPSKTVSACSKILKEHELTISFAESATAGRLASEFSLTADSGSVLTGGLICYDACIKEDILGIPSSFVERYTPESEEVTREMAVRLKYFMPADIQVAVTGLTTPGGSENEEKPVGTMFIHILLDHRSIAVREVFDGTPEHIVLQAIDLAAQKIIDTLEAIESTK